MKLIKKKYIIIYLLIVVVIFNCNDYSKYLINDLSYISCGSTTGIPSALPKITTIGYTLLMVGTPLALIIFSIITLIKANVSSSADEISKARGKIIRKIILAILIFVTAALVKFVISKVTSNSNDKNSVSKCINCFLNYNSNDCPESSTGNEVYSGIRKSTNENNSIGTEYDSNKKSNKKNSSNKKASSNVEALSNMMFAVESGGMVYGNRDYTIFGECYENSSVEVSITIGGGGWMGLSAKNLLEKIQDKYPETFKKNDKNNIVANALKNQDWSAYCIGKNSDVANAIVDIISSDDGKKAQDELMNEQMEEYIEEAESKGVTDAKAQVMYIDIRHVGGEGAVDRLLKHANKPYTLDEMYKVVTTPWSDDPTDGNPANGSMYTNRHNSFKKWAEEYIK